jgi:septin family protein
MKEISNLTNIIPVISKINGLERIEIINLKTKIVNEGREKYKIQFLELDTCLNILCRDPRKINYLLGGHFEFCPPFVIFPKFEDNNNEIQPDSINYCCMEGEIDDSDFPRFYFILISFIPFECIEKTKIIYRNLKKQWVREKIENEIKLQNKNNDRACCIMF